jgi:predicted nucleic acid-binding protein
MKIDYIIDTSVLIDLSRGRESAISWFVNNKSASIAISGFTVFEMLEGARNKKEMDLIKNELKRFNTIWPYEDDFIIAVELFSQMKLKYGIDVIDILIAQTALRLGASIVTLNKKHFIHFRDLNIIVP